MRKPRKTTWTAASRWQVWARDLAGRRGRRPIHPGGPERVLARPPVASVSRLVRERWLLASRTLQPQIHLAIQPVLRPRSGPGLRSVLAAAPPMAAAGAPLTARGEPSFAPMRTVFSRAPEPATAASIPATRPASTGEAAGTSRVSRPAAAPLQRVFQRLRDPGEVPVASGARTGALPDLPETARHLAHKVRREELPLPGPPSRVLATPQTSAERSGGERSTAPWDSGPAPRTTSWPGSVPAFPVPSTPVDVGALTDRVMQQIDHRLHAWSERTGF